MTHFTEKEFTNCTPTCKSSDCDKRLLAFLDEWREKAGIPIVLNCVYRSREWDIAQGRNGNSAHTRGLAADVRIRNGNERYLLVKAALALGVRRIGIGKTFLHVDLDESLPQDVMFDYYE